MVHLMLSLITKPVLSHTRSSLCEAEGKQEELVWAESLCRGGCGRPIQEDREMHQHPQPQMETAHHCVSIKGVWSCWYKTDRRVAK